MAKVRCDDAHIDALEEAVNDITSPMEAGAVEYIDDAQKERLFAIERRLSVWMTEAWKQRK